MKKSYEVQCAEVWAKEAKKASEMGFASVKEWRQYQADQNRKKSYEIKIARLQKFIPELQRKIEYMQKWVEEH